MDMGAVRSSVRSLACSTLLTLLAHSTALIWPLICSLTSELVGKWMIRWNQAVLNHSDVDVGVFVGAVARESFLYVIWGGPKKSIYWHFQHYKDYLE